MKKRQRLPDVNATQAMRLKAAGFNWPTTTYYERGKKWGGPGFENHNSNCVSSVASHCSAPTVALALRWARNVMGMRAGVFWSLWEWVINIDGGEMPGGYSTYELAESALLDAVLCELEKRKKAGRI